MDTSGLFYKVQNLKLILHVDKVSGSEKEDNMTRSPSTLAKLKAVEDERDVLLKEVQRLKLSAQNTKEEPAVGDEQLREQLKEVEEERDQAKTDYSNLLKRVTEIRSTLGQRLKDDAV
jgi:chromosome segregation ATPase